MAPISNIPGFYYDESKKKYFKIQPNHRAPVGSPYTLDSIRDESREQSFHERSKLFEERTVKERTQRSKILSQPLVGPLGLSREHGRTDRCDIGAVTNAVWAKGLRTTTTPGFLEKQTAQTTSGNLFAYDDASGAFVITDAVDPENEYIRYFFPTARVMKDDNYHERGLMTMHSEVSETVATQNFVDPCVDKFVEHKSFERGYVSCWFP